MDCSKSDFILLGNTNQPGLEEVGELAIVNLDVVVNYNWAAESEKS